MSYRRTGTILGILLALLVACNDGAPAPIETADGVDTGQSAAEEAAVPPTATMLPTATAVPPTPTPAAELAAMVNDEPILLETYEQEVARYEQARAELGADRVEEPNYHARVLNALIERELIAQAAAARGITITPDMVDAKITELRAAAGDEANFEAWLQANSWTEAEFREALATEMLTEAMVAVVTEDVPYAVEQVRARLIQVNDPALAQSLKEQIAAGADFATLATAHSRDPVSAKDRGDLGFFARGSLLVPAVEEAAFNLQPGETSDILTVTDDNGNETYYLVQVVERDPQRPLMGDMRVELLEREFEQWLENLRRQADIQRFIDVETET